MKRVIVFFCVVCISIATVFFLLFPNKTENIVSNSTKKSAQKTIKPVNQTKSVFVPYWAIPTGKNQDYYQYFYFGILVDNNGINKDENGYQNLPKFVNSIDGKSAKFLTIKMLDTPQNLSILKSKAWEQKIINQSVEIAKNYSFDGIVLDLEVNAMPFDSMLNKIDVFVKDFYSSSKESNLKFYVLLYGDTFYRIRPYNVENIAKNSDKILIMAYDFSKSKGDPGPNFPYGGQNKYGYDFQTMIEDFSKASDPSKLGVIFGMYGYDWVVDEKDRTKVNGEAVSLNNIKQKYINSCSFKNCKVERDSVSLESKVTFLDDKAEKHVLWFEDETSFEEKAQYLRQKGISDIILWAYSYF